MRMDIHHEIEKVFLVKKQNFPKASFKRTAIFICPYPMPIRKMFNQLLLSQN